MINQSKKLLVTGAKGFIGSNTTKFFKTHGYQTYAIGHGDLSTQELQKNGIDHWRTSDVTVQALCDFNVEFDLVVHCGGSGSVGLSVVNPYSDFKKTVDGTLEVLEFIRLYSPGTHLIYPSSPAVQGEHPDSPIEESFIGKPCSPYGYHKRIAEDLCKSYSEKFGIKVSVLRLFSVYGIGLKKQILWDAVAKILNGTEAVEFYGSGNETRDFIHIDDVVKIFFELQRQIKSFEVVNGGTGIKRTISEVVEMVRKFIDRDVMIKFDNQVAIGNPIYYWASQVKLKKLIELHYMDFENELEKYVIWAAGEKN